MISGLAIIIAMFLVLIMIGIPVGYAMVLTSAGYFYFMNPLIPGTVIAQHTLGAVTESFSLLAVPLFLLAGSLLNRSGMTDRMVAFGLALVGHIRGGLGHTVVVANVMMAGISGSATSDAAGIGKVMIPALKKAGYRPADAAALNAAAATLAPIIPPSVAMVIYSSLSGVSLGRLLLAGVFPGGIMAIFLMVNIYFSDFGSDDSNVGFQWRRVLRTGRDAALCILMPVIILGGMIGGIYSPTEGAAAAVVYTLLVGVLIYRQLKLADIYAALQESAKLTGAVLFVVAASSSVSWILSVEHAGNVIGNFFDFLGIGGSPSLLLLVMAAIVLVLGTAMDETTMLVLLTPILAPAALLSGVDPVQFGVVFVLSTMMGLITPPVGLTVFISSRIAGVTVNEFSLAIIRPFLALTLALIVCCLFEDVALFLPDLIMGIR
jgi:tripartite ATP-independent transporter DctM subunit